MFWVLTAQNRMCLADGVALTCFVFYLKVFSMPETEASRGPMKIHSQGMGRETNEVNKEIISSSQK